MSDQQFSLGSISRALIGPSPFEAKLPRYLYLDGMRGLAAIAVLFWHYQHFFMKPGAASVQDVSTLVPLHYLFAPLYDHGAMAVPLFWIISGFVFAAVYGDGKETTRGFVINRIARLYPLHLLTLLLVAMLQALVIRRFGQPLFYGFNDLRHFLLNLVFASAWRFGMWDQSFNGPVWSVSIEVLIYAVFWCVHRRLLKRGVLLPVFISACFVALSLFWKPMLQFDCGWLFFFGSAIFALHRVLGARQLVSWCSAALILLVGLLFKKSWVGGVPFAMGGVVLAVATLDSAAFPTPRKLLSAIGDSTYGIYLWHVPIQLIMFLLIADPAKVAALARSPLWLAAFLIIVVVVARLSFLLFERPMRDKIRRFAHVREADAPVAAP